jgi:hypothetical protein
VSLFDSQELPLTSRPLQFRGTLLLRRRPEAPHSPARYSISRRAQPSRPAAAILCTFVLNRHPAIGPHTFGRRAGQGDGRLIRQVWSGCAGSSIDWRKTNASGRPRVWRRYVLVWLDGLNLC